MNKKAIEFQQEIKDFISKVEFKSTSMESEDGGQLYKAFYESIYALMDSYRKNYKKELNPAMQLDICEEFFIFSKIHTLLVIDIIVDNLSADSIKKLDLHTLRAELFWDLVRTIEAYQAKHGHE